MIHLRPDSVAYARSTAVSANTDVGGYVTPDNTVLEGQNPSALVQAMQKPVASVTDSFKATLSESIGAKALRGVEYASIPTEAGFEPSKALGDSVSQYTADELEFLSDARSSAELAQRRSQVQDTRNNYDAMGQNMLTTVAASMLDVDMVIGGGVGILSKVSRATRLAVGLSANAALLGAASYGGTITPLDVVGTSVGIAMSAIPGIRKVAKVEQVQQDAVRGGVNAAEDAAGTVVPPKDVTVPPVREAPEVAPVKTVADEDYPKIDIDTYSNKQHIEVGRTGGSKQGSLKTTVQNAVLAVTSLGDDLPEGVRALGRALGASLEADADVPVVFRSRTGTNAQARSAVITEADTGATRAEIFNPTVGGTLSDHIKGMSTYEKTILLHEAAHAKTGRSIRAVESGAVSDGVVYEAVQRIKEIQWYVKANVELPPLGKGAKYNVDYGLSDTHEFISQLFNSEHFRDALRSVKMPGSDGTLLSNLMKRVVTLFTGKAPEGNAFDATLQAFDNLLSQPTTPADVFLNAPKATPDLQSKVLQAPNVIEMNNKVMGALNRNFSLYERLKSFGYKASTLADQLVVDATGTEANSAAHHARAAHLASNVSIVQVDDAFRQALSADWPLVQRLRHPVLYREAQRDLSQKVYQQLAENHDRFLKGQSIQPSNDPRVNSMVDAFVNSNWAKDELARVKGAGINGADAVRESPYYLPRQHSGNKLNDFMRNNRQVTKDDIVGMYTEQFSRMFQQNGITPETARKLGAKMFDNMQDQAAHVQGYRQSIAGMSYDDIENTLEALGASDPTITAFLDAVKGSGEQANKVRNLRGRAEFDMTAQYTTKSGDMISPSMFVNNDVMGLMEGYSRRMSGRVGLAKAGFPDLRDAVKAIDEAAAEAQDPAAALHAFDNTMNQILGYPTGEDVPDILRSANIIGGALNLANSGIYQLADMSLMLQQFGITKTLKAFGSTAFGRNAMDVAKSAEFGSRLQDVIEARHVLSGKYRSVLTHLEDNRDIGSLGVAHRYVQQMGQGTRFVNGMEFIRRGQAKLVSGLIADTVDDAIAGNASAVTAMERFGLNQQLLDGLRKATAANPDMRKWPDSVRMDIEAVTHNMADSIVLENRLGEIPAWMQFSSVGKVILPYMTFVAGAWNKILRRTAKLDGATGVAIALAYQMPLVTLSSATSIAISGKPVTPESVAQRALVQVPMMSWAGFAVDFWANGASNNLAALALVDRMHAAMSSIASGETNPESLIKAVPFLSILPGMRLMGASLTDDDE
ncbi:diguanylate cyclase/phosphodiesterase [Pectobacterium phage Momine]|uniref:Diguanylate cyclase/phosphodiesterase n=1 Tax=Pectobacterium phage Momine TaxID=2320196 RepID=A0A385IGE9_9CAUD|nr:diguanylate cyclase/phosphodiesterase [Pectobacterium phage Momine]